MGKQVVIPVFIAVLLLGSGFIPLVYAETIVQEEVEVHPQKKLFIAPAKAKQARQVQTRRIDTADESMLFSVCIDVLQDLGFTINKFDKDLGYARGVKDRDAKAPAQELAMITLNILAIITGNQPNFDYETDQTITAMVVVYPVKINKKTRFDVRISFHRFLRQPFRVQAEIVENPELYKSFFSLLDKAMYLKRQNL